MNILFSIHWTIIAALFYFGNGLLLDLFALKDHKGGYNRDLLLLLMDGHLLMLSGAVMFMCYLMLLSKIQCGAVIAMIVSGFMLLYCAMMLPFQISYANIAVSVMAILVAIRSYGIFPSIWEIMGKYR